MQSRKKGGFTLIELMILAAIIGILAAVAIPNFIKFQTNARQSEAKTNLRAVYVAMLVYFSNANTYPNENCFARINWTPAGLNRYTYQCGCGTGTSVPDLSIIQNKLPAPGAPCGCVGNCADTSQIVVSCTGSSRLGFTVQAVGNIDSDTDCDGWQINDAKVLTNPDNDV